jgi:hypothetical protein
VWWCTSGIPGFRRLRQEFLATLSYKSSKSLEDLDSVLKNKKHQKNKTKQKFIVLP